MHVTMKISAMTVIASLMAACGGGGGGSTGSTTSGPSTIFTYQEFDSTVTGTSDMAAAGWTRSNPDAEPDGTQVVLGTLSRATQTLAIDGIISSVAQDEVTGNWRSGTTTVSPSTLLASNDYDFLLPVEVTEDGGEANTYVIGVVSRTQDFPEAGLGDVRFTGQASVGGLLNSTLFESTGNLTITADYDNRLVDVLIEGLNENGIPFDTVEITNLGIATGADATFSSSNTSVFSFENSGGTYTPATGNNTTQSASVAFFGGDSRGPAEAGGAFSVNGDTGNIYGIFAAGERGN